MLVKEPFCKRNHVIFFSMCRLQREPFQRAEGTFFGLYFLVIFGFDFFGYFFSIVPRSTTLNRGVPYLYRISTGINHMYAGVHHKSTELNRAQPGSNVSLPG